MLVAKLAFLELLLLWNHMLLHEDTAYLYQTGKCKKHRRLMWRQKQVPDFARYLFTFDLFFEFEFMVNGSLKFPGQEEVLFMLWDKVWGGPRPGRKFGPEMLGISLTSLPISLLRKSKWSSHASSWNRPAGKHEGSVEACPSDRYVRAVRQMGRLREPRSRG